MRGECRFARAGPMRSITTRMRVRDECCASTASVAARVHGHQYRSLRDTFARRLRPDTSPARTRGTTAPTSKASERDPGNAGRRPPTTANQTRKENCVKHCNVLEDQTTRRALLVACSIGLAVACPVSLPRPAPAGRVTPPPLAGRVTPPSVPPDIQVEAGNRAFLKGHGVGTQNYICLPCPNPTTPAAA